MFLTFVNGKAIEFCLAAAPSVPWASCHEKGDYQSPSAELGLREPNKPPCRPSLTLSAGLIAGQEVSLHST